MHDDNMTMIKIGMINFIVSCNILCEVSSNLYTKSMSEVSEHVVGGNSSPTSSYLNIYISSIVNPKLILYQVIK